MTENGVPPPKKKRRTTRALLPPDDPDTGARAATSARARTANSDRPTPFERRILREDDPIMGPCVQVFLEYAWWQG